MMATLADPRETDDFLDQMNKKINELGKKLFFEENGGLAKTNPLLKEDYALWENLQKEMASKIKKEFGENSNLRIKVLIISYLEANYPAGLYCAYYLEKVYVNQDVDKFLDGIRGRRELIARIDL